ncbi:hypothetical protein F4813DRAFT_355038 [Daldinia decipiens]|uniref:uncharacterized protein n=1 Tax=Daldinia decipiens TaxID=326647 RepID=UPI0020C27AED|nr:uncharacterized protein F4813DRAFT_355038 [Daldinia decipiens]KAI1658889.1 hypothetical protein F4813DRAFT_355038 [Daldinia decipiens]
MVLVASRYNKTERGASRNFISHVLLWSLLLGIAEATLLRPMSAIMLAGWLLVGAVGMYIFPITSKKQTSFLVSLESIQSARALAQFTSSRSLVSALYLGQSTE